MPNTADAGYAHYLADLLRRDLLRFSAGQIPHGWTGVLLWMSEEVAAHANSLRPDDALRKDMLLLADTARRRVREARKALRGAA